MIDQHFVILGALLSLTGSIGYARQTLRGRTRPNRVTWMMWSLAPLIGFAAELSGGVGLPAIMTLSVGLGPLIVLVSSFFAPAAHWRLGPFDLACGALSVLALILWQTLHSGNVAISMSILADGVAGMPTLRKIIIAPETEHTSVFRNSMLNAAITLLTIRHWTFSAFGFPLYILIIAGTFYALLRFRPRAARRQAPA
ncbi:MAG: hypothetical protein JOZ07_15510 [Solirubrobacterales bacterium]|nr:hypothetical protein [Solirubrobacterales bacterium]